MAEKNKDFFQKVYAVVRQIPAGKVCTYGRVARAAGLASGARMVGWALNGIGDDSDIPAHRVVNRLGELSGKIHFGTPFRMKELLLSEGITFKAEAVDLDKHLWEPDIIDDY